MACPSPSCSRAACRRPSRRACQTTMRPDRSRPTPAPLPAPALRGHETDALTVRVASVSAPAPPAPAAPWIRPWTSRPCWKLSRRTLLLLVVAVACALPACALADRPPPSRQPPTSSSAPKFPPLAEDFDHSLASTNDSHNGRRRSSRESDEYADVDADAATTPRLHPRRSSAEVSSDDDTGDAAPPAPSDRRHHNGRHVGGGGGGRSARKQQQQRKRPVEDDRPPVPLGHGGILGGCSVCEEREAIRNWSLAAIKEQILHKLNLQQPPNITGRRLPKYEHLAELLDAQPRRGFAGPSYGPGYGHAHGMLGDDPDAFGPAPVALDDEDDYHAKMERIIAFPQTHMNKVRHSVYHTYQGHNVLHFRFSSKVTQSQVAKATLWLFVRGTGHAHRYRAHHYDGGGEEQEEDEDADDEAEDLLDEDAPRRPAARPSVLVNVLRMRGRAGATADAKASAAAVVPYDLEATVKVEQADGDGVWVMVDVKKMVEDWFRRPRDNLGIMVHAHSTAQHGSSSGADAKPLVNTDTNEDVNPKMPFIEVYLKEGRKRRQRRALGLDCDENSDETRCCRYPLVVDFELFGWDFIIFPKKYEANYCSGECPFVYMQKYPHTALMHLALNKTGPCCAPRKMSPINMLYFDNDLNVVFGVLPGMVVERCGCF